MQRSFIPLLHRATSQLRDRLPNGSFSNSNVPCLCFFVAEGPIKDFLLAVEKTG
jgi:hypothetical protein